MNLKNLTLTDPYADKSWQVGSNGAGKRHWFVWRHGPSTATTYQGAQTARDSRGNARRFGSFGSALRVATALNNEMSPGVRKAMDHFEKALAYRRAAEALVKFRG